MTKRKKAKPTKRKLTQQTVDRATAGKKRRLIWDLVQAGLALSIEPGGRRSFKFIYSWPRGSKAGRPVWLTWQGGLAEARDKARANWALINSGIDPRSGRPGGAQMMTFKELHDTYVNQWARKQNRRWRETETLVNKHLTSAFGDKPAAQVTRADIREVISKIRAAGHNSLANRALGHVAGIFKWAAAEGVIEIAANPAHGLTRSKPTPRDRWLAENEIARFWAESFHHGPGGASLRAMLLTGQRGGEVVRYSAADVEDGRWWNIAAENYKSGKAHRVYLADDAIEAFAQIDWGAAASIGQRKQRLTAAAKAIVDKLGHTKWTPHTMRHTTASHLARLGIVKEVRARVLGHSEGGGVHSGYVHHSFDDEKRAVMNRWEQELRRIIAGKSGDKKVVPIRG